MKLVEKPLWWEEAACRGMDTGLFFPAEGLPQPALQAQVAEAEAVCGRCAVRDVCWVEARSMNSTGGVFGGELMHRLDRIVRPGCGTVPGRHAHYRRDEKPCEDCKAAFNTDQRQRRRSRAVGAQRS